jgi:spore germination cell wall hydrolase CwlJ-like protein
MKKYTTSEKPATETTVTETDKSASSTTASSGAISCTDEEFNMLCYVLQGEVGDCSDESKLAVANVIINRVKSSSFPDSISGVLTQSNQFTAISGYYSGSNTPTESTIECARRAVNGEDNSNGAIYYYAPNYCSGSTAAWFETLTFCLELDGQRYFK